MQKQSKQNNNILDRQNNDYNIDENDKLNKGQQQQEEENAIVHLKKVSFEYKHHNILLLSLNNIFFNIFEGDILGIIGPNGSRKTTLFHCIMELQNRYSGNILLFNQDIHKKIKSNEIMMAFSNDIISKVLKGVKGKSGT
jgi:ABC-type bacteriocin/lantibiotic exporter with double-glycine peptidase domain